MATRLDRSSDVQDFDTYPANPPKAKGFLRTDSGTGLEERARQVGSAMGKAVVTVHKTQERLKDIANQTGEAAAARITHMKNMAQETASRVSDLSETMKTKAQEWAEAATARANQVVRKYPVQVVLIAGAIGFLFGVGLRIWRMNREY